VRFTFGQQWTALGCPGVDEGVPRAGRAGRRGFGMAPVGQGADVLLPRATAAMEAGTGAGDAVIELGVARW
jgi:hypothetical protein